MVDCRYGTTILAETPPSNRNTAWSQMRFDMICEADGMEHRPAQSDRPWTDGRVERMDRAIKEANVKRFRYESMTSCGYTSPTL